MRTLRGFHGQMLVTPAQGVDPARTGRARRRQGGAGRRGCLGRGRHRTGQQPGGTDQAEPGHDGPGGRDEGILHVARILSLAPHLDP